MALVASSEEIAPRCCLHSLSTKSRPATTLGDIQRPPHSGGNTEWVSMKQRWILGFLAIGLQLGANAHAQSADSTLQETRTELTSTSTATLEEQARIWGITTEDYRRFQEAMKGPRGRFSSPNITPIEVLGIEAETAAERQRFAEIWVETIRADTTKVLAFSRTVNETWRRLHGDEPLVDRAYINRHRVEQGKRPIPTADHGGILADPTKVTGSDQLLLFTEVGCESCNADVLRLAKQLEAGDFAGLDIYLLDVPPGDIAAVQSWAAAAGIPVHLVRGGRLTLNFDGGAFRSLTNSLQFSPSRFPVVMRKKGQSYDLVALR